MLACMALGLQCPRQHQLPGQVQVKVLLFNLLSVLLPDLQSVCADTLFGCLGYRNDTEMVHLTHPV